MLIRSPIVISLAMAFLYNGDTHNLDLDRGYDRKDALDGPR